MGGTIPRWREGEVLAFGVVGVGKVAALGRGVRGHDDGGCGEETEKEALFFFFFVFFFVFFFSLI